MDRANYFELFSNPEDHILPKDDELSSNTQYPNLNSKEYRIKSIKSPPVHKFYETFAIKDDEAILAANNIRGRIWNGSVKGFKDISQIEKKEEPCFETQCDSPVTNLLYTKDTLFILSLASGVVQLWSPKSEVRNDAGYCLFMIDDSHEHRGIVLSMDILLDDTNVVTGSNDCCLKIWHIGADLSSVCTMNFAHADSITGISASTESDQIFASCSQDKSALIWDYREVRPATGLIEDHPYAFTAINWINNNGKCNQIILGDESGKIHFVDVKMPHKILYSQQVFKRPIRKIQFHGEHLAVVGNITTVKAFKFVDSDDILQLVYKNSDATDLVRDVKWDRFSEREFYTISWDSNLYRHTIPV